MTSDTLFRFGRCEVDAAARRVNLDGRPSAIEPRPFELLEHLIRQRHRVVSKQELLEKVWPGQRVSSSALARAVMKLRQAIGDGDGAPLIRTVPRVGYHFVAPLDAAAPSPGPPQALTLALLPFDNATGEGTLDWVELGLMSMVTETLARDGRFSLVGMASLLGAIAAHDETSVAARVAAVQRHTGARLVVHGRLVRTSSGWRLDYRVHGQPGAPAGAVIAARPIGLAAVLAQALVRSLAGAASDAAPAPVGFADPLAAEAYARGLQAAAEQRLMPALNLFRAAHELEPGQPAVQLELLRALAPTATGSAEVECLAAELLVNAEGAGDMAAAARVHQAVGRFHLNRSALDLAEARLQLALQLAGRRESLDWTAQTLLLRCTVAFRQRRFADGRVHLARARGLCEHSGNRVLALFALNLDACLAAEEGRLEQFVQLSVDAARGARALRAHRFLCDACGNASLGLVDLGRLAEAAAYAEEAFAAAMALGDRALIDVFAANACHIYHLAGEPQASARLLATLDGVRTPVHQQGLVWQARGHHAACRGDAPEAARCFAAALQLAREPAHPELEQAVLPWCIEALILSARLDEAQAEMRHAAALAAQGNRALQTRLLHLQALLAHRQGRPDSALGFLEQVLAGQPAPLWRAWACADAAWLLAEAGDAAAAGARLAQVDASLAALPAELAAQARVLHAAGDAGAAQQAHRRCVLPSCL
jgi:DNA-binding winged helix-turn-helix (wHTH) protein